MTNEQIANLIKTSPVYSQRFLDSLRETEALIARGVNRFQTQSDVDGYIAHRAKLKAILHMAHPFNV